MRISINIKRPDNWYQGTRIVITDSFYNATTYNPFFSTDYNTNLGQNDLPNDDLKFIISDNYINMFIKNPNYKIIVYALTYDGVIDIARGVGDTYYKYSNGAETALFTNDCLVNNGAPINEYEQNFIEKNIKINNAAYNKYYKFEIAPTETNGNINNIELKFTYEYSNLCNINKFLNCATSSNKPISINNTIIYDGISDKFKITNVNENISSGGSETPENRKTDENDGSSETPEDTKTDVNDSDSGSETPEDTKPDENDSDSGSETPEDTKPDENNNNNNVQMFENDSKSKLDNQTSSYIIYKSKSDSDYSPVLSLDAHDEGHTFLGWYKTHSSTPYALDDEIEFTSLFEGFISSQKVTTFDYKELNDEVDNYVYFFAVYSSQQNEIIPFENRKMRIMKVY